LTLFRDLETYQLLNDWIPLLDWLLSNNRFAPSKGWNKNKKSRFTNRLKKLQKMGSDDWVCQPAKADDWTIDKKRNVQIKMTSDAAKGESLIRHIRNGIAHGEAIIRKTQTGLQLDICDYRDDKHTQQTAHIWIPIETLLTIHQIYTDIEKGA